MKAVSRTEKVAGFRVRKSHPHGIGEQFTLGLQQVVSRRQVLPLVCDPRPVPPALRRRPCDLRLQRRRGGTADDTPYRNEMSRVQSFRDRVEAQAEADSH